MAYIQLPSNSNKTTWNSHYLINEKRLISFILNSFLFPKGNGYFLALKTGPPAAPGDIAVLDSEPVTISDVACLSFWSVSITPLESYSLSSTDHFHYHFFQETMICVFRRTELAGSRKQKLLLLGNMWLLLEMKHVLEAKLTVLVTVLLFTFCGLVSHSQ